MSALFALFTETQYPVAICIFIDGLDEFDGPYDLVLEKLGSISRHSHIKICLSSRPLLVFERAFADHPSLKLQELTLKSILAYAKKELSSLIEERFCHDSSDKERARRLEHEIVRRSEGVFLWVVTAIRDVREGLQDAADLDELESMIRDLPLGIESLYIQMLERIKPAYRREAIRFLHIVMIDSEENDVYRAELDLYRFFFIDCERSFEDRPFSRNSIKMDALTDACHNLRKRILGHTLGLLDLIPPSEADRDSAGYYASKFVGNKSQGVVLERVIVHHRTVVEFLRHNAAAKSFIEGMGSTENYLRVSIARGSLTYLDHTSQRSLVTIENFHATLHLAMYHVTTVERLIGAAQFKLMRSLDACTFSSNCFFDARRDAPFLFTLPTHASVEPNKVTFDLVGMAASHGMERYIHERLDFPMVESNKSHINLLDFQQFHSTSEATALRLSCSESPPLTFYDSDYRRWLSGYLICLDETAHTNVRPGDRALAETYLLFCVGLFDSNSKLAPTLRLAKTLLQAGADPMAKFEFPNSRQTHTKHSHCFWIEWLQFLERFFESFFERSCGTHLPDNGSGNSLPIEAGVTMDDIFDLTKDLLVRGADINACIDTDFSKRPKYIFDLTGTDSKDKMAAFYIQVSAMFLLEKWFHCYPEWRAFAIATKPPLISPWRRIICIQQYKKAVAQKDRTWKRVQPSKEDSEILWPLIEKWEKSGQDDDHDRAHAATMRVFEAHRPAVVAYEKLDEEENEDTDGEIDEDMDEEVDDDIDGELYRESDQEVDEE